MRLRGEQISLPVTNNATYINLLRNKRIYDTEILIKPHLLEAVSLNVDVWAFGRVLFNLVNPNLKYPFQQAPMLEQLREILHQRKHASESPRYTEQSATQVKLGPNFSAENAMRCV